MNRTFKHSIFLALIPLMVLSCKKEEEPLPTINLSAAGTITEGTGTNNSTITVTAKLSFVSPEYPVEVSYYTRHVSTDDDDIEVVSSSNLKKITFADGDTEKSFEIEIKADGDYEANEEFSVTLTGPVNALLGSAKTVVIQITNDDQCTTGCGYVTPLTYSGYDLMWSDEFDGPEIDETKWVWEQGGGGWGNNEEQNYTNRSENSYIENGSLVIVAKKESFGGNQYTSARMITSGKYSFKYGRVDIRAKVPDGRGVWPALWMLGDNIWDVSWPMCGEIDIMELVGYDPLKVHATGHWGNTANDKGSTGNHKTDPEGYNDKYHVFSLVWDVNGLTYYVDDVQIHHIGKSDVVGYTYPFDANFFFIFNIAVGGNWGGIQGIDDAAFPQKMIVDYIRVFQ